MTWVIMANTCIGFAFIASPWVCFFITDTCMFIIIASATFFRRSTVSRFMMRSGMRFRRWSGVKWRRRIKWRGRGAVWIRSLTGWMRRV